MGRRPPDATTWALILGIWSAIGLFRTLSYARIVHGRTGTPLPVRESVLHGFGGAYLWAAVTAVAVVITRNLDRAAPVGARS